MSVSPASSPTPAGGKAASIGAVPVSANPPGDLARRRRLVGLVVSGAPLMLSLPTTASGATVASAFRAAINDSVLSPAKEVGTTDGWLRVPAIRLQSLTTPPTASLYRIGARFYQVSDGLEVFDVDETLYTKTDVFLLVLFTPDLVGPTASIGEGVPFPIRSAGQGLHQSAWASVSPGGTQSYDGVAWVS